MAEFHYTSEQNVQIVVALLKAYGIKRIVASPGATNVTFVVSVQFDPFFEVYSCVDERSAAYMACGMAAETGEPVVLSCTGATSSRNYMPALTEAYYRKLPILAITSSQESCRMGQLIPQVTDRTTPPSDVVRRSFQIGLVKDDVDTWDRTLKANAALSAVRRKDYGPVHINLETRQPRNYFVEKLPSVKKIDFYEDEEQFPTLPQGKIGIFLGSHREMTEAETKSIDAFCDAYDAVVLCDQTSGYYGKFKILSALVLGQVNLKDADKFRKFDTIIHVGEISGDYFSYFKANEIWRVNPDGELRDPFKGLSKVFCCKEKKFFDHYVSKQKDNAAEQKAETQYSAFRKCYDRLVEGMPELPLSNAYIAKALSKRIPAGSYLHLGILNSLRAWNLFETNDGVKTLCNVGGFGIDGVMSTAVGGSMVKRDNLHFCVLGDLSFFYDMNCLGNHHIANNLRVLLINNGRGVEFRTKGHVGDVLHDETDKFIAAAGHFGNKSKSLVRHYAEDLGFVYLTAETKVEFKVCAEKFVAQNEKPIILEVFTTTEDEHEATRLMRIVDGEGLSNLKSVAKQLLPDSVISLAKKIIK